MSQKKNLPVIVLAIALVAAIVLAIVGFAQRGDLAGQVSTLNSQLATVKNDADAAAAAASAELETAKTEAAAAAEAAAAELETAKTEAAAAAEAAAAELATAKTEAAAAAETAAAELEAVKTEAAAAVEAAAAELATVKADVAAAAEAAAAELATVKADAAAAAEAAAAELATVKADAAAAAEAAAAELATVKADAAAAAEAAAAELATVKADAAAAAEAAAADLKAAKAAAAEPAKEQKDIVVLFTSDIHCGVEDNFGYAGLAAVKAALSQTSEVILVDDGDAIQGAPVGTMTKGEAIIDIMNAIGYDVATMGNHEFDYGMENFLTLAEKASFPYVSANFTYMDELVFKPYTIIEKAGKKIAFVGITTPRTFVSSTPTYFQNEKGEYVYGFMEDSTGEKLYAAVQKAVDAARAEGADYVIAMAHLGTEAECSPWMSTEVIANTTGIDALLDGHAHETMAQEICANKDGKDVVRAACGTKLATIGCLTIKGDGAISSTVLDAAAKNGADAAVAAATESLNAKLAEVVAHSDVDLTIVDPNATDADGKSIRIIRSRESNLGDLCADAYLDQAGADIAMVNGGGIRVTIKAGDITLNDVLLVHPFGNSLTMVEATGAQVLDALEWASRNVPGENGGFLQVAGLTYEIHTYIESSCTSDDKGSFSGVTGERRVKNVLVAGQPIDPEKTYKVASHDYMLLNGGDGTNMFQKCPVLLESVKLDNQVLIDYIVDTLGGNVGEAYADPYGQGRITIVTEAPAAAAPAEEAPAA